MSDTTLSYLNGGMSSPRCDFQQVNELFIHTQPAHLQKLQGEELEADRRNVARANYLRQRLSSSSVS